MEAMEAKTDYQPLLKSLGLKSTPKRLAMLEMLDGEQAYLSPEDIWKKLKRRFKSIGLPTIYRNLEELEGKNVITKVIHPNRQLYYYFCRHSSHHHHFVCISCKKVQDFTSCAVADIEREIRDKIKGKVVSHIFQVNGLCRECV